MAKYRVVKMREDDFEEYEIEALNYEEAREKVLEEEEIMVERIWDDDEDNQPTV